LKAPHSLFHQSFLKIQIISPIQFLDSPKFPENTDNWSNRVSGFILQHVGSSKALVYF